MVTKKESYTWNRRSRSRRSDIEEPENTTKIYDILENSTKTEVIYTDFIIPERIEHEDSTV